MLGRTAAGNPDQRETGREGTAFEDSIQMDQSSSPSGPGLPALRPEVKLASQGWGKGETQETRDPLRERPARRVESCLLQHKECYRRTRNSSYELTSSADPATNLPARSFSMVSAEGTDQQNLG